MEPRTTTLDAALGYASLGWKIFPVRPAPAKQPLTAHGFRDATTDHARIVEWWSKWPSAQVGVACGDQIAAIDLDLKPDQGVDGLAEFDALQMTHGAHGCGLEMVTPRGGRQLFYRGDSLCRRRLGVRPGIDVLGDGGYTIVPSPASPGRSWRAGDPSEELATPPSWVAEFMVGGSTTNPTSAPISRTGPVPQSGPVVPLTDEQVRDIRGALAVIPNDERRVWLEVGFALRSTRAGEQAYELWSEWARSTPSGAIHPKYDDDDQRRTWAAASEFRPGGSEITLASLFWIAQQHGYTGGVPPEPVAVVIGSAPAPAAPAAPAAQAPAAPADDRLQTGGQITLLDWEEVAELPPIEWMVDQLIARRSLVVLAGNTEAGKSFAAIDLSMRLVHGMPVYGREAAPGSVLYLAGEGHDGLGARFRAWRREHTHLIPAAGKQGRYCLVSDEIPTLSAGTIQQLHQLMKEVEKAKGHAPAVVFIDTLSQAMVDDESDSSVVSPIMRGLAALRQRWGCTIILVHHLVKMNGKLRPGEAPPVPSLDSIRGSGAITRNVDTVLGLVCTNEVTGARSLFVWKQKDGSKLLPIELWLQPVVTGRARLNGADEWSCVMIPATDVGGDEDDTEPEIDPDTQKGRMARVVGVLTAAQAWEGEGGKGGMSRANIATDAQMRSADLSATLDHMAREKMIRNVGTKARHSWVLAEKPPAAPPAAGSSS
jgi:hypothetical protein